MMKPSRRLLGARQLLSYAATFLTSFSLQHGTCRLCCRCASPVSSVRARSLPGTRTHPLDFDRLLFTLLGCAGALSVETGGRRELWSVLFPMTEWHLSLFVSSLGCPLTRVSSCLRLPAEAGSGAHRETAEPVAKIETSFRLAVSHQLESAFRLARQSEPAEVPEESLQTAGRCGRISEGQVKMRQREMTTPAPSPPSSFLGRRMDGWMDRWRFLLNGWGHPLPRCFVWGRRRPQ